MDPMALLAMEVMVKELALPRMIKNRMALKVVEMVEMVVVAKAHLEVLQIKVYNLITCLGKYTTLLQ